MSCVECPRVIRGWSWIGQGPTERCINIRHSPSIDEHTLAATRVPCVATRAQGEPSRGTTGTSLERRFWRTETRCKSSSKNRNGRRWHRTHHQAAAAESPPQAEPPPRQVGPAPAAARAGCGSRPACSGGRLPARGASPAALPRAKAPPRCAGPVSAAAGPGC